MALGVRLCRPILLAVLVLGFLAVSLRLSLREKDQWASLQAEFGDEVYLKTASDLSPSLRCDPATVDKRIRKCYAESICIDPSNGLFLPSESDGRDDNEINLTGADPESDFYWRVTKHRLDPKTPVYYLPTATLVLGKSYFPYHLTHFLVNNAAAMFTQLSAAPPGPTILGIVDLYSEGKKPIAHDWLNATSVWPLRLHTPFTLSRSVPYDRITHETHDAPASIRGSVPVCIARATIGLGNICPFTYCAGEQPEGTVPRMRDQVLRYYGITATARGPRAREEPRILVVKRRERRRLLNADEVAAALTAAHPRWNVRLVELEGWSFQQQVAVFANADVVVTIHGNAEGNMLWMEKGSVIVELFAYQIRTTFFESLASSSEMKYAPVYCDVDECLATLEGKETYDFYRDLIANVTDVVQAVETNVMLL